MNESLILNKSISYFLVLILSFAGGLYCQERLNINNDSLLKLDSYKLYEGYIQNFNSNVDLSRAYAVTYLRKAKIDNIDYKMAYGYGFIASFFHDEFDKKVKYLDSAINISQHTRSQIFPTLAYVAKGVAYENEGVFSVAMDNYIKGYQFAKLKNDTNNISIINHNIALLKIKLGKYNEAKTLLKQCLKYEEKNFLKTKDDSIGYLTTLAELVTTYRRNKEIDSAIFHNNIGAKMAKDFPNNCLYILNEGILKYHKKDYLNAIENLNLALEKFLEPRNVYYSDNNNLIDTYFYLGKTYEKKLNKEKSIFYYKKIDSLVLKENYIIPEIRPAYDAIIKYYKSIDDKNNQLFFINRLLHNDSILDVNFKNLNNKIIREYDTPILLSEKEKIIRELKSKNDRSSNNFLFALISIGFISLFLLYYYRKQRLYKFRFEKLLKDVNDSQISSVTEKGNDLKNNKDKIDLAEEIVEKILNGLNMFEKKHGYTQVNITSVMLAKQLKTNPKYLTKVIKHFKRKNFSPYINDLRIDYIIQKLKTDKKLRNYTIKALAKEAGFNSTEVFSKYFHKKTGIYPSYFVKKIQRIENQ